MTVFAVVTTSGSVVLYNRHVSVRAIAKIMAHSGVATAVDWHPRLPHVVATGGATDRSVKVWMVDLDGGGGNGGGAATATGGGGGGGGNNDHHNNHHQHNNNHTTGVDWTNSNTWSTSDKSVGTTDSPVTEGQTRYVPV
jgi:hypothetical protein